MTNLSISPLGLSLAGKKVNIAAGFDKTIPQGLKPGRF